MSALRVVVWGTLLLSGGCGGCEDGPPSGDAPPLPSVTGLEPRLIIGAPGEAIRIPIEMTDAGGNPVEPYELTWLGVAADNSGLGDLGTVAIESAEGRREVVFTAAVHDRFYLGMRLRVCTGDGDGWPDRWCNEEEYGPVTFLVAGGDAVGLTPLAPEVRLHVGEHRAVDAHAFTHVPRQSQTSASRDPVTATIADPAIATVAGKVVTAVAPGSTTLTFQAGAITKTVPVTVITGPLEPPTDGMHTAGDNTALAQGIVGGDPIRTKTDHQLAIDSRGYPVALVLPTQTSPDRSRVWVAEWTGSGFGHQRVGPHHDWAAQPQLAVDERDRRYVVYTSLKLPGLWVADRAVDAGPDEWMTRPLPRYPDPDTAEPNAPFDNAEDQVSQYGMFSLLPRAGGGLWVAYVVWGGDGEIDCVRTLRLVEITDAAIATHDIERREVTVPTGVKCESAGVGSEHGIKDLYLVPGAPLPRLVLHRAGGNNIPYAPADLYEVSGTTWTSRRYLPVPGELPDRPDQYEPVRMTIAQPQTASPIAAWYGDTPLFEDYRSYLVSGLSSPWKPWVGQYNTVSPRAYDPFAMMIDGSLYQGDGFLRALMRTTPYGSVYFDDPTPLVWPRYHVGDYESLGSIVPMVGATSEGERLHWLVHFHAIPQLGAGVSYVVATPPRHARHTDNELDGWRISDHIITPLVTAPPVVLASGTRLLVTAMRQARFHYDNVNGLGTKEATPQLLRSAGPGQPWVDLGTEWWLSPYLFEHAGALHGVRSTNIDQGIELVRSTDAGSTWSVVASATVNGRIRRIARVGATLFVLVWPDVGLGGFQLLHLADLTAGGTFTDVLVGGGQAVLRIGQPSAAFEPLVNLIASATGVTLYHAGASGAAVRREFSAAGALLADESLVTHDPYLVASTAVRRPDGSIVALRRAPTSVAVGYQLVSSTDELRTVQVISTLSSDSWTDGAQLLQRSDGSLVAAAGTMTRDEVFKAVYRISTDGGFTWSAERMVRPAGGNGQSVAALAEDGTGLLVVVADNNSMRAWANVDLGPFTQRQDVLTPLPDLVIVRVPAP